MSDFEFSERNVHSNCNYELCADILDAITTAEQYKQCLNRHASLEVFYLGFLLSASHVNCVSYMTSALCFLEFSFLH